MLDFGILGVTMRMATPILLAGTGTLYNDRAGVTNITLEGSMLLGGFFAVACSFFTGSWGLAVLAGIATGVAVSLVFYFLTSVCGGDELVVGFSMNILLDGLSIFLLKQIFHQSGSLVDERIAGVPQISSGMLGRIPILGDLLDGRHFYRVVRRAGLLVAYEKEQAGVRHFDERDESHVRPVWGNTSGSDADFGHAVKRGLGRARRGGGNHVHALAV